MSEAEFRERIVRLILDNQLIGLKTEATLDKLLSAQWFGETRPLASDPILADHFARNPAQPKNCFENCQGFVRSSDTDHATYFEGYVSSPGGILIHHGWLVLGGAVFDPTLEVAAIELERRGLQIQDRGYFGVSFSKIDVVWHYVKPQGAGAMLCIADQYC